MYGRTSGFICALRSHVSSSPLHVCPVVSTHRLVFCASTYGHICMNIYLHEYKSSLAYASPPWPPPAAARPGLMAPPKRRSASMALHAGSWWLLQRASLQRRRRAGAGRATVAGRAGSATVATATVPLHWSGGGGKAMANVGSLCEYMAHVH